MTVLAPPRPGPAASAPSEEPRPPSTARALATAALASAAAAWMIGGLFVGAGARAVALGGVVLGVGMTALSTRVRRASIVQYLVLPAAAVVGALLALPDTSATRSLQDLVVEAIRSGGLAQAPVPFDPGWRFLVIVVTAVLSAASASLAYASRPVLAIALAAPVVVAGGVAQPQGTEVLAAAVALGLLLAAFAVSSGEELGEQASAGFEARRLGRGAVAVAVLAGAIVALSRAGFLFPDTTQERIVPAQRPPVAPPQADRVLFTVDADTAGPWRLGVLDIYDGLGWLLPPLDPARMADVPADGVLAPEPATAVRATFTVADLPGRVLPGLAEPASVTGLAERAQLDPRTGVLRLPEGRARDGLTYTVVAPGPPSGRALSEAGRPPEELAEFLSVPPAPNEVEAVLADAPQNPWDRLVFLRARLYENVIAAGAGEAVDVPPARAAELLGGAEATPYEITATEALLARWAGVPSRIGFGFFSGETGAEPGTFEVRPRHGATWLEVYFNEHGWVPIVGVPPRARASLSPDEQRFDPNVTATDELALIVYVPVELQTVTLLATTVRYWLSLVVPPVLGLALVWWTLPGVFKLARARRRRRWARRRGPRARIAVAYASFRDAAADIGIDARGATPLGFTDVLEPDDEHDQLAWLVTRALWGDLRRDAGASDADDAERLARSLTRRLRRAFPPSARALAFGARTSLRAPYTDDVPNLWPRAGRRAALVLGTLLALSACARAPQIGVGEPGSLPTRAMPSSVADLEMQREPDAEGAFARAGEGSLIHEGRIYTLRDGTTVQAYVEHASFRSGVDALDQRTRDELLRSIGAGRFRLERIGDERAWVQELPEQRMLLAFAPDGESMTLLVARRAYDGADGAFVELIRHLRGETGASRAPAGPMYDPRTGESR